MKMKCDAVGQGRGLRGGGREERPEEKAGRRPTEACTAGRAPRRLAASASDRARSCAFASVAPAPLVVPAPLALLSACRM
eukprot:SAG22_NODE_28_length_28728_cov_19.603619_2_plen_80_part_00